MFISEYMKLIRLIFFIMLGTSFFLSAKSYAQQPSERYTYEDIEAAMISADFETMQNQVKVINNILSTNSNPRDRLALNEALGMLYLHLGNYDEGHEAFRKCWDIVQHSYPLEFSLYHRILFGMIITSEDNGVRMDVLDKAADYTDIQDGSYYHHINIAISSAFIQDYDFAIEEFNTALDLQNDDNVSDKRWSLLTFILTLKQVNNMYVEKGEYDTALRIQESFQRNIQESFGRGSYYDIVFELEKASTFLKLGNIDKAQASLNLVRRLAADGLIHFADFYALQGDIAYAKNDFLSANVQYNTAASIFKSLNRNYTSIMIKQMTCLSKLGFDEEAEKMSDIIDAALDLHYDNTLTAEYLLQYSNMLIDNKVGGLAIEVLKAGILNIEDIGDYDSQLKVKNALGAGKTAAEIADVIFAEFPENERMRLILRCMETERLVMAADPCQVGYPGVKETLLELKKKYRLFLVSNSEKGYPELLIEKLGLQGIFEDHMCHGDTNLPKGDTIRILMERHEIESAVYIGDTQGDLEACEKAGIPFVFCAYGFGTPARWDAEIDAITELPEVLRTL